MERELRERLISSRRVFEGRLISVHVDEVELAEGTRTTREVVSHPGAVAVVPMLDDGTVVMIQQYRHAAGEVLWELPAGTLGDGERPEDCARRELAEEVGYEAGELRRLFSTYLSPGYSSELIHLFVARALRATSAHEESDERIKTAQLPLEEAIAMIERGEVQNAAAICGLLAVVQWLERRWNGSGPLNEAREGDSIG